MSVILLKCYIPLGGHYTHTCKAIGDITHPGEVKWVRITHLGKVNGCALRSRVK